jgi:UDP-glucose 4-epimerase
MDQRITIVTGGAGFIGCHVARELCDAGHRVVVLDDLSGGFAENVDPRCVFVRGSITDGDLVARLFREHPVRYVYHLAAYAAEGLSHFIRRFNYTNNLIGSVTLINEAIRHEVECFVFASSIAVYGAGRLPMREDLEPQPEDPYGIAKAAVERDLKAAHEMFGLESIVFRPHNVYGENQNIGDRYRNVVGIFLNQLMEGRPLTIFGDGRQTRAFSYIGDVAPCLARAVDVPAARNQVFNIGADRAVSLNELAEVVMKAYGERSELRHLPARNEVKDAWSDHEKARRILGFEAATSLEEGVSRTVAWAREHGARRSPKFEGIEVERGLPSVWLED